MAHGASVLLYGLIDQVANSNAASGGSALVAITACCFIACHPGGVGLVRRSGVWLASAILSDSWRRPAAAASLTCGPAQPPTSPLRRPPQQCLQTACHAAESAPPALLISRAAPPGFWGDAGALKPVPDAPRGQCTAAQRISGMCRRHSQRHRHVAGLFQHHYQAACLHQTNRVPSLQDGSGAVVGLMLSSETIESLWMPHERTAIKPEPGKRQFG